MSLALWPPAGCLIFPAAVTKKLEGEGWEKKPLINGWQRKATTDLSQIRDWWVAYPHALPGIELGRSGLVVLDGDRHGGPDGAAALNDTRGADTPRHPISLTAGGGETPTSFGSHQIETAWVMARARCRQALMFVERAAGS